MMNPPAAPVSAVPADIAALLAFNETGAQFFRRVQQERVLTGLHSLDSNLVLRPGVVLEAAGPPGSGKTELLTSVLLSVLVAPYLEPAAWVVRQRGQKMHQQGLRQLGQQAAGGGGGGGGGGSAHQNAPGGLPAPPPGAGQVVLLDLDGKSDSMRLGQVISHQLRHLRADVVRMRLAAAQQQHQRLRQQLAAGGLGGAGGGAGHLLGVGPGPPPHVQQQQQRGPGQQQWGSGAEGGTQAEEEQEEEELLTEAQVADELLSRLHVVRCLSSMQLLATLVAMPARLEAWQAAGVGCRLLLLDNVGAHYWRDRAARNVAPPGGAGGAGAGGGGAAATPYHAQHHHHQHMLPPSQQHTPMQQQQQQGRPGGAGAWQQQPLPQSLFEVHAAIAARLQLLSRRYRLPVIASKTAAVTARGLVGGGGDGDWPAADAGSDEWGPRLPAGVQLQQREFMPMPWQNVVTHRLLLYPRGVTNAGPLASVATASTQLAQQHACTTIWAELAAVGTGAAGGAAGAVGGAPTGPGTPGGVGGGAGGRCMSRLVIARAALIEV